MKTTLDCMDTGNAAASFDRVGPPWNDPGTRNGTTPGSLFSKSVQPAARGSRPPIPTASRLLLGWFTWYSRRYIRRHFHSMRVSLSGLPPKSNLPLVFYSNHASWWDPLVGLVLKAEFFADRSLFTPMDAAMLRRYKLFGKLGFFGVEQHSRRGAVEFLRTAVAITQSPRHILAVTPQSRFADVRERPVRFEAGLGHLAARTKKALFVPFVTEYVFWEERLPEILVRFGEPALVTSDHGAAFTPDDWTRLFQQNLERGQDALARESQQRNPAGFQELLRGGAGQGGVYDLWQKLRSMLRGEEFRREHGDK